jgi:hypothetical protein
VSPAQCAVAVNNVDNLDNLNNLNNLDNPNPRPARNTEPPDNL